ncbi:MAG: phosphatidate cytidylyltransferase [Planctomycetia bacterium]|nr:phosphatidate cytidylyltransferase [Planctomycetia bacterium]
MLRWRLLLGVFFIAVVAGLAWADLRLQTDAAQPPGVLLLPLALLITLAATQEFLRFVRTREPLAGRFVPYVGNVAIVAAPWLATWLGYAAFAGDWQATAFAGAVIGVFLFEMARYDKDRSQRVAERIALSIANLAYVGLLMSYIVRLRLLPYGIFPIVSMLIVVKLGDIGAYTFGRLLGRRKMAPKLSPGKTVEGLLGGVALSVVGGLESAHWFGIDFAADPAALIAWSSYAVVVCLIGVAGDLAESLLKRDYGLKDSSAWLPGFGGVFDMIDSLLLAAPVAWVFWQAGWIGPARLLAQP